jgi:hypothetical protein
MRNPFSAICLAAFLLFVTSAPAEAQIVNTLRGFDETEDGWTGGAAAALAVADGNTEYFELEFDARAQFQTEHHRLRFLGFGMRRTAGGEEVAQSRIGHARHNYRFRPWLSSIAFVQAQYDPYLRIETRLLAGAGARFDVFHGELWRLALGGVVMHESEDLTDDAEGFSDRERFSFFVTLYRLEEGGVDLDLWGFYQPVVDDFGNARVSAAASAKIDIVGNIYVFASYIVRHNSTPPPTVKKHDQSLRSGVGIDF